MVETLWLAINDEQPTTETYNQHSVRVYKFELAAGDIIYVASVS